MCRSASPACILKIDGKIGQIRKAVEGGLSDAEWTNPWLKELMAERDRLTEQTVSTGSAPQIDAKTAMAYRRQAEEVLSVGSDAERKQFLKVWVAEITISPEELEVEITYRLPEPLVLSMGAAVEPIAMHSVLVNKPRLPDQASH